MFAKGSVKKPFTVAVGVILVIVLGVISFMNMTTDLLPSMNLPYIVVYTTYAGASPESVESEITKPLEASMATVSELKSIRSTSSENVSMITMEFNAGASMDTAMLELNARIDLVRPNFPDGAGTPTMIKINPDMLPVVVASVDMEGRDIIGLSDYVDKTLMNKMEGIDGVASVDASGLIEEKVTVSIEQSLIDEVNDVILKEVDKKLYDVEQELLEGERKLNDAKHKLDTQGRAGLRQINSMIAQLEEGQRNLDGTIAELEKKKQGLRQQLAQVEEGIAQIEAALKALEGLAMGAQEAEMLSQLNARLESLRNQREAAQRELDYVESQIAGATPTPAPPTPKPTRTPRPTRKPGATPRPDLDQENMLNEMLGGGEAEDPKPGQGAEASGSAAAREPAQEAQREGRSLEAKRWFFPGERVASAEVDPALVARRDALIAQIAELDQAIAQIENSSAYQALNRMEAAAKQKAELEAQLAQAQAGKAQLEAGIAQMDAMIEKLKQGILPAGMVDGIDEDTRIEDAKERLIQARAKLRQALSSAADKIEEAQSKLGEARKEFEEKREDAFKEAKLDGVITVPMISQIIGAQNLSMPAGYITEYGQDYLVRVGDEFGSAEELASTVLFTMDLDSIKQVLLGDVATVEVTNNADEVYTKVNGNDGVLLTFQKQSTYSTAQVADNILAQFKVLEAETPGLHLTPLMNQGVYIDMIIDSVLSNLMWGALLAVLVLLLFLRDHRPTLIIALSIPISVVVAFVAMYFTGITLNVISLAGLALGVGMLVDNSVVVIENIYRLRSEKVPVLRACVEGTSQMSSSISSSTLTTICVFLPLVFITGIARDLFSDMGLTITYSLLASLVVAMTVVPALASWLLKRPNIKTHDKLGRVQHGYGKVLRGTLRFKLPVLLLALALLVFSVRTALNMGTAFMPEVDSDQMTATLTMPKGATFRETTDAANAVMEKIMEIEDVATVGVFTGGGMLVSLSGSGGDVSFYMLMREGKTHRNTEVARMIEERVQPLNLDLSVRSNNMDISMLYGSGISIKVRGADLDKLRAYASDIAGRIALIEGTADVSDGQEETVPEVILTVDKQKAVDNGLTVGQIYQYVASWVSNGTKVTDITMDDKNYAVMAVDGDDLKMTREDLANKTIEVKRADETIQVRLGDVCDISEGMSLSSIAREQQQHVITVSCDAGDGYNIGLIGREISAMLADYEFQEGYSAAISGESETIASTLKDLILMIGLAVVLIYLIMVAQFQSFLMPFIVLFTIPLAITGGLLALILAQKELSVVAMLGFLILAGVIVNNGIVFVDTVNQLRAGGMEKREALIQAGQMRMRPILMTALTTILGMFTMAMGQGMGAEMMQPLALVTIGGLTYGTFLTMFVVPALYDLLTRKHYKTRKIEHEGAKDAPLEMPAPEAEDEKDDALDEEKAQDAPEQTREEFEEEFRQFMKLGEGGMPGEDAPSGDEDAAPDQE